MACEAPSYAGLNTVSLDFSATPIADVFALAATASGNGVVEFPAGGSGAFAVATINLGTADSIRVTLSVPDSISEAVAPTICQTDPSTGACLSSPATSVTLNDAASATPIFAIFLRSTGSAIPFDRATNRIFVDFASTDEDQQINRSTSVAIETTP